MIYSDILTKTEQVRDRLVSAINSKGGSLVSNASLNQCADAVANLPEGGGGAKIPGQIFHASFAEDSEYAESGQPLIKIGTLVFGTVDGIPCVRLGEGGFQVDYPPFTSNKPFTISYWGKCVTENDPGALPLHQGVFQSFRAIFIAHNGGNFYVSNSDGLAENAAHVDVAEKFIFHHYLATYDQKKFRLFVDGEQLAESSYEFSLNIPRDPFYIGYNSESINTNQFYLANMRIFTRVLSADEISMLYDEFVNRDNPSGGGGSSGGGAPPADLIDLIERDITSIEIPDGTTKIGINAFRDCKSLTSVIIPSGVTSIGDYAFRNCTSLTSVTIPDSVTSIGSDAFYECTSLTDIYCGFSENAVPGAPWGAPDTTTIHYNA